VFHLKLTILKNILLFLLLPICCIAQKNNPVAPILSNDYFALIQLNKKDSTKRDTANSFTKANLYHKYTYYDLRENLKNISVQNNELKIKKNNVKTFQFSTSYSLTASINKANNQPQLQNTYAQGYSNNGTLEWQGAETNNPFSYGPLLNTLSYDASNYKYDINGKLVQKNDGGLPATGYNNSIIKRGSTVTQSLNVQGKLSKNYYNFWEIGVLYNNNKENLILLQNKNTNQNILFSITRKINNNIINGSYFANETTYSNSNYNGFLNKAYMNSLITPVSFSNKQNHSQDYNQQSFYNNADNPFFLINNNNHYNLTVKRGNFSVQKNANKVSAKLATIIENTREKTLEISKPSHSYFANGNSVIRSKKDKQIKILGNASYKYRSESRNTQSIELVNNVQITNSTLENKGSTKLTYDYNRVINQTTIKHTLKVNTDNNISLGSEINNSFYFSNTSSNSKILLPNIAVYFKKETYNRPRKYFKIVASLHNSCNELPITQSMSYINLLQLNTIDLNKFSPITEVSDFKNLKLIEHKDYNTIVELGFDNKWTLTSELYWKKTKNDIFPIVENNKLQLRNVATHTTKGIEIELRYEKMYSEKLKSSFSLSFNKYNTMVNNVVAGLNYTPIAGFNNVFKAVAQSEPLGIIMGNTYLKDADNNTIIDVDGYPVMNSTTKIIGNSTPNFIMKYSNLLSYKNWTFNIDMEWKNGGKIWNGTQAVLDYYGKSKTTEQQREITNYIYEGVTTNGTKNTKAVNFYDKNLPVSKNRWVRYGYTGVAENYIEKADQLKLNNLSFSYFKICKKHIQQYSVGLYVNNIILWSPYSGVDSNQLLLDQPNSTGLDFFNLPSTKNFGITLTIKY
jgi:hypothetical protein